MNELLTVKQVAELLQLHEMTIRRYIRSGKLEAVRVGRRIRVPRAAVEAMLTLQVEKSAPAVEASMLREPAVAYHVGDAAPVTVVPPTIERITADYVALDDEDRVNAGKYIANLRAEREKQEREELFAQILIEARQLAQERADWPREKVVEQFREVAEEIRRQAIEKGTAIEGDWIDD